ncbi:hypothetical protein VKT23_015434 [Stygiomarasmius scandens]|uniref:Uncharacterized protein n=1 Tax=Marasmiellus scandens TaxID=2682957 RepID=A0ABR1IZ32_9AGAR
MKLTWGKEQSHEYKRQQVEFYVINDGYPIDFYISHGSGGGAEAKGNARVTMEGQTYINHSLTDDNYNTMWFYQKEVSSVPVNFSASPNRSTDTSAWDHTLEQYLHRAVFA